MIKKIVARLKEINEQINGLHQETSSLNEQLVELVLKNKEILNEAQWQTDRNHNNCLTSNERYHIKLSELLCKDYHQSIDAKACSIHFSDGEISLVFFDDKKFSEFVKNNNVKIDIKDIEKDIRDFSTRVHFYQRQLEEAKKLLKKVKKCG